VVVVVWSEMWKLKDWRWLVRQSWIALHLSASLFYTGFTTKEGITSRLGEEWV
jgi:hypothetical protein